MFVYQGKMNWWTYAKDETFVVVLPNGPVRVGDSVYLFWKWTVDAKGVKNGNVFQTISVDSVTQTSATDVTFVLKGSWYSFTVTTKGGYENISIVMRNPQGGVSDPMPLKREWKSDKELTGTTRIWTGKFKWMNFARDEHAIFIVPDGFGEGKPIISTWQWTKASNGKTKEPSFRAEVQRNVTGLGTDTVKFSYKSYYDIKCTWDGKKDQLDVWVTEGAHSEDVGDMIRSAIIERSTHSHDFNPPRPPPTKSECELYLPQPQASLPRLVCPLPFPKDLLETLAHTAAYVDQCGYLAKYAQDRFAALDADYHFSLEQIKALKIEIENINKTKGDLTIDRDAAIAKSQKLQEALDKALKDGEGFQKEIARLNKVISDDKLKDAEALKVLEKTRADLKASQEQCSKLQAEIAHKDAQIAEQGATISNLQKIIITLETTIAQLRAEVTVKTSENEKLAKANITLEGQKRDLENSVKDLQDELARAQQRIKELQETAKNHAAKDKEIRDAKARADSEAAKSEEEAAKALAEVEKYKQWAYDNKVVIDLSKY
ncbi:hypothetical protein IWW34DRAFT_914535 [Fusarium oxysporum f. sp. albedinis]|uniref:Uncharacterized protein n=6 Tax=Fusarium oxysporum TaxID=5507 RepID=A0A420N3N6_FUSOX|nr:hypothetical protein FOXG_13713 [Fusarium oxysporum f. sp. lycopersici 4287]XP_031033542.2 uncharacterized protein FOBCDRAFT_167504 [Fusarium oxysporum Fo47]EWZ96935.1 hypothetical protein FOWG_04158 [Fusarium oxysporum f. sp. lycopersici MN25]EXK34732.1 hypothetical protein FOMG_10101 [Fusarium oxysporum f. sp. melonis 26406]KAF5266954.1 hypothetical protein FOXYS1_2180 [Fusarium oxysporum]KAI3577879.1 hypothetical protein IWW34DRAFT_914535 [Fusarium oxysporum f. sp. albedinis]PCD28817.1 